MLLRCLPQKSFDQLLPIALFRMWVASLTHSLCVDGYPVFGVDQVIGGKAPSPSKEEWLKLTLGAAQKRDRTLSRCLANRAENLPRRVQNFLPSIRSASNLMREATSHTGFVKLGLTNRRTNPE